MAVRPWVPTDAQGVTVLEFDPSVSGSLTLNGSTVTAIAAKNGSVTASTSGTGPTLDSAALNGFPALVYTGSQVLLTPAFTQGPNWAAFVAVSPSSLSGTQYVLDADQRVTAGGNQRIAEYIRFNSTNVQSLGFAANQSSTSLASTAYGTANTPRIVGTTYPANNTVSLSLDGGTPVTAAAAPDSATGSVPLAIGGSANGTAGLLRGAIGYAGLVLGVLSSADYDRYVGYLAWRFNLQGNLPAGHPYKSAAPTIDAGGTAYTGSVTEAVTALDSVSAAAIFTGTRSEPASASDTAVASAAFAAQLAEAAIATDAASTGGAGAATLSEAVTAADVVAASVTLLASLTEAVAASDIVLTGAAPSAISEPVTASDMASASATYSASLTEAVGLGDSLTATAAYAGAVAEPAAATDAIAGGGAATFTIAEAVTLADAVMGGMRYSLALAEAASVAEAISYAYLPNPYPYITPDVLLSGSLVGPVTLRGQMQPDLITLQARLRN